MRKLFTILLVCFFCSSLNAQDMVADSADLVTVTIKKDPRLNQLAKIQADLNSMSSRFTKGYRLLVLKSNDRDYTMKIRTYLLQNYPDQKILMSYQAPFIKLRFGNFTDKKEAEKFRDILMKSNVITGNVYVVSEIVEVDQSKLQNENGN